MSIEDIKKTIEDGLSLFEFRYNGKDGNVDHCYEDGEGDSYLLWFDGEEKTVFTIDDAINDPFFDGKSLASIANDITDISY